METTIGGSKLHTTSIGGKPKMNSKKVEVTFKLELPTTNDIPWLGCCCIWSRKKKKKKPFTLVVGYQPNPLCKECDPTRLPYKNCLARVPCCFGLRGGHALQAQYMLQQCLFGWKDRWVLRCRQALRETLGAQRTHLQPLVNRCELANPQSLCSGSRRWCQWLRSLGSTRSQ